MPVKGHKRGAFFSPHTSVLTALVLLLLIIPSGLRGQIGTSGITGTVTDPTGALVPDAKITVKNEATNVEWSAVSSATGAYMVRNLSPGSYTVTAQVSGFQKSVTEHVVTEVEKVSTVDITLAVGAVTESVTVAATPTVRLNTESGTVGQLVTTKEIETLPLNGRSWISLNFLTPGAVRFHGTTAGESAMAAVTPPNVVLNGLRGGNNAYYLDGSSLQQRETQVILVIPPLDALGEFRVQTGNFSAEYLGGAGGVVSAATKGGTNKIHGNIWEYLRNNALDARSFFDKDLPPLRRNQFGFTLGGPIRKDRTFFFGGYEGFRQRKGVTLVGDYPTAAMRAGDLSDVPQQLINPLTGQPFSNNQIPVHPLSARWLNNWIPLPNTNVPVGQGNYRVARPAPIDYDSYVARIDHTVSEKTSLFGRYYGTWTRSDTPWFIPGFLRPVLNRGQNYVFQATRSFTPTAVGQFRFSYNRTFQDESTDNAKGANMLDELGVVPGAFGFETRPDPLRAPPPMSVSGLAPFGSRLFGRPRRWYGNSYFYDLLFFLNRGSHNMKMGGNVNREFHNFPENISPVGLWQYSGDFTGSGLGDFLLGYPRLVLSLPGFFHQDLWNWQNGIWFQDDWKVNRKLTLNLGLRWDYDGRWLSSSGTLANWDVSSPPTAVQIFPRADAESCPSGGCSPLSPNAPHLVDSPKYLWSPRVGFAYRARENTVVRGGYGIYWQPLTTDPFVNMSLNEPFITIAVATYDVTNLPTFDRTNPLQGTPATSIGAFALDRNIKDAYIQQWNLTLEQMIGANRFSIAYVGNQGTNLYRQLDVDLAPPGPGPIQPRRPFTNVGGINTADSAADSSYHALQLRAERRVARGLSFTASYAWGKVIDTNSGSYIESQAEGNQQPYNLKAERSSAEFDVRHALTFSYIYELPFGRGQGFRDKFIGGWQIQGMTSLFSGDHRTTVWNSWDNLNNGGGGYPDRVCNPNLGGGRSSGDKVAKFFETACFAAPAGGTVGVPNYTFGNSTRHPLDSPGIQNWDLALQKDLALWEGARLRFTAEFFNGFNHPNFSPPNTSFGTPQFGRITSAADGRDIQFGLKIIF